MSSAPPYVNFTELSLAVQESLVAHEERQQERLRHPGHRSRRAVKRVCYGELGCFEDSGPFAYLEMLPSPPEEINTKFYFYSTRQRSDRPLMELSFLNMTNAFRGKRETEPSTSAPEGSARSSSSGSGITSTPGNLTFSTERPGGQKKATPSIDDLEGFDELSVRVIVHGFGSACPHVWIYEMKTALMAVVSRRQSFQEMYPLHNHNLFLPPCTGGLHCDLRGLGERGHLPQLC